MLSDLPVICKDFQATVGSMLTHWSQDLSGLSEMVIGKSLTMLKSCLLDLNFALEASPVFKSASEQCYKVDLHKVGVEGACEGVKRQTKQWTAEHTCWSV